MQRFNFENLCDVEVREQSRFKISKRLAALENLHDSGDINMAWENIGGNII
jgi:hypothetical protein